MITVHDCYCNEKVANLTDVTDGKVMWMQDYISQETCELHCHCLQIQRSRKQQLTAYSLGNTPRISPPQPYASRAQNPKKKIIAYIFIRKFFKRKNNPTIRQSSKHPKNPAQIEIFLNFHSETQI